MKADLVGLTCWSAGCAAARLHRPNTPHQDRYSAGGAKFLRAGSFGVRGHVRALVGRDISRQGKRRRVAALQVVSSSLRLERTGAQRRHHRSLHPDAIKIRAAIGGGGVRVGCGARLTDDITLDGCECRLLREIGAALQEVSPGVDTFPAQDQA